MSSPLLWVSELSLRIFMFISKPIYLPIARLKLSVLYVALAEGANWNESRKIVQLQYSYMNSTLISIM